MAATSTLVSSTMRQGTHQSYRRQYHGNSADRSDRFAPTTLSTQVGTDSSSECLGKLLIIVDLDGGEGGIRFRRDREFTGEHATDPSPASCVSPNRRYRAILQPSH